MSTSCRSTTRSSPFPTDGPRRVHEGKRPRLRLLADACLMPRSWSLARVRACLDEEIAAGTTIGVPAVVLLRRDGKNRQSENAAVVSGSLWVGTGEAVAQPRRPLSGRHLMSDVVKGFGCRPWRDGWDAAEGRRPKASRGGNRGGVEASGMSRLLWGFGEAVAGSARAGRTARKRFGLADRCPWSGCGVATVIKTCAGSGGRTWIGHDGTSGTEAGR